MEDSQNQIESTAPLIPKEEEKEIPNEKNTSNEPAEKLDSEQEKNMESKPQPSNSIEQQPSAPIEQEKNTSDLIPEVETIDNKLTSAQLIKEAEEMPKELKKELEENAENCSSLSKKEIDNLIKGKADRETKEKLLPDEQEQEIKKEEAKAKEEPEKLLTPEEIEKAWKKIRNQNLAGIEESKDSEIISVFDIVAERCCQNCFLGVFCGICAFLFWGMYCYTTGGLARVKFSYFKSKKLISFEASVFSGCCTVNEHIITLNLDDILAAENVEMKRDGITFYAFAILTKGEKFEPIIFKDLVHAVKAKSFLYYIMLKYGK